VRLDAAFPIEACRGPRPRHGGACAEARSRARRDREAGEPQPRLRSPPFPRGSRSVAGGYSKARPNQRRSLSLSATSARTSRSASGRESGEEITPKPSGELPRQIAHSSEMQRAIAQLEAPRIDTRLRLNRSAPEAGCRQGRSQTRVLLTHLFKPLLPWMNLKLSPGCPGGVLPAPTPSGRLRRQCAVDLEREREAGQCNGLSRSAQGRRQRSHVDAWQQDEEPAHQRASLAVSQSPPRHLSS